MLRTFAAAGILLMWTAAAAAQSTTPPPAAPKADQDAWRTVIYPVFAWVPIFGANVSLPEQPGDGGPTIPTGETSGNIKGAVAAGFRLERQRFAFEGEFLYAGLSGHVAIPRFDLSLDTGAARMTAGFKVARAVYVNGGVRYFGLAMTATVLDFAPVTWKPGIWQPIVGATFRPQLSRRVRILSQLDFGWRGDTSRSFALKGYLEWKWFSHFSLGGGYGMLYLRADGTILLAPVHVSQTLHGPMIVLGIPF